MKKKRVKEYVQIFLIWKKYMGHIELIDPSKTNKDYILYRIKTYGSDQINSKFYNLIITIIGQLAKYNWILD